LILALDEATETSRAMRAAGVTLDPDGGAADDDARLVTTDPKVAEHFGFDEMTPVGFVAFVASVAGKGHRGRDQPS
jgi:hypothetical protein